MVIGNSVKTIGERAFYNCTDLFSVTFNAEKCSEMGSYDYPVFEDCKQFTTLTFGEKVTMIPPYAFYGCSGLLSLKIPESVTEIGEEAFTDCNALTEIVSAAPNPPTCGADAFSEVVKTNCTLYVLEESVEKYKAAEEWKDFLNTNGYSGVDEITVDDEDAETLYDVYNMQGVKVGTGLHRAEMTDALPHGVYILVSPQGSRKEKI